MNTSLCSVYRGTFLISTHRDTWGVCLPSNLEYLLIYFKLIEKVNVLKRLFPQLVALFIGESKVAHRVIFLSPPRIVLLNDLVHLCKRKRLGIMLHPLSCRLHIFNLQI